eukprot:scaffold124175_cov49-Attheya_sp.AAC.2
MLATFLLPSYAIAGTTFVPVYRKGSAKISFYRRLPFVPSYGSLYSMVGYRTFLSYCMYRSLPVPGMATVHYLVGRVSDNRRCASREVRSINRLVQSSFNPGEKENGCMNEALA